MYISEAYRNDYKDSNSSLKCVKHKKLGNAERNKPVKTIITYFFNLCLRRKKLLIFVCEIIYFSYFILDQKL